MGEEDKDGAKRRFAVFHASFLPCFMPLFPLYLSFGGFL
jgi:hypothetical protein